MQLSAEHPAKLAERLPQMHGAQDFFPAPPAPRVLVHTYNPSTQETKAGRLQVEDRPEV